MKAKAAVFEQNAERNAVRRTDCLAIDLSPEGERIRRYELSCTRTVLRSLGELTRLRRAAERAARGRSSGAETPCEKDAGGRMKDQEMPDNPQTENRQSTTVTSYDPQRESGQPTTDNPYDPADLDASTSCDRAGLWDEVPNLDIEPNLGVGPPADPEPVSPADTAEPPAPDQRDNMPNLDIEPDSGDGQLVHPEPLSLADPAEPVAPNPPMHTPDLSWEPPPPRFSPVTAREFHTAVMKDLRRQDAGGKAERGSRRRDRRGRPRRDSTNHHDHGFLEPAALEIRKHSPLLASLSNARFTKLLDEVEREFEEELT